MDIIQTSSFIRQIKKIHKNQKIELDFAIKAIISNPRIGELKKGNLAGIQVYKFSMGNQLTLLAFEYYPSSPTLILLSIGSHENFYRDLKA